MYHISRHSIYYLWKIKNSVFYYLVLTLYPSSD